MSGTLGLAFLAGLLSTLSPCVLPLIPVVLGTAAAQHRLGPVALALGLALSFAGIGLFVATIGFGLSLDGDLFRTAGAVLMIGLGLVLALPRLQAGAVRALHPAGRWAEARLGGIAAHGLAGQFGLGLLLGAAWSPCVGPTLGAASLLAARAENLGAVGLTMLVFGLGAALPLALVGLASREVLLRWRGGLASVAGRLRVGLGVVLVVLGGLVLSGLDKRAEALAVAASPDWLTKLTTRY